MPAVTIPFDYDERTHPSVVPICIDDTDAGGNLIYRGWIEHGVVPAADRLRRAAKVILRDVWRVSEITESAVQRFSRKYLRMTVIMSGTDAP